MQIDIHKENNMVIFNLIGKYDISEVHNFETMYKKHLDQKPRLIALKLQNLKYIDSSGIGSLVRCMNLALKNDVEFICFDLNENVESIFKLAKLDQFITLLTEEEFMDTYVRG
ncbi:MAG: STAS domain-containing protein [Spirochaetota bacterium]